MKLALTQEQPEKPVIAHKENFETLKKAFASGDVALMEVQLESTGERLAAICAVQQQEPDGEVSFVPFAVLFNGNPYEMLNPPNPDGGFFSQEECNSETK